MKASQTLLLKSCFSSNGNEQAASAGKKHAELLHKFIHLSSRSFTHAIESKQPEKAMTAT